MHRREVLVTTLAAVSLGMTGCTAGNGDGAGGGTPTETPDELDVSEDLLILLHNHLGESVTVAVRITAEEAVVIDERITIAGDEMGTLETRITDTGRYELAVSVEEGSESRSTFEFEEYDLEMGSNFVVWIDDEIRLGKED